MEVGTNTDPYDEYEFLAERQRSKKPKLSRKSSADRSINKLKIGLLNKEKFFIASMTTKFYSILLVQQFLAFLLCFLGIKIPSLSQFIIDYIFFFISCFLMCALLSILSFFWKKPFRKSPYNFTLVLIFTFSYAYLSAYICLTVEEITIMMANFTIFVVIVILLIYCSMTEENFGVLSASFLVIVAGGFHFFFYKFYTSTHIIRIFCSLLWISLWGFYLIFWTWKIIHKVYKLKKNDYVLISFKFYVLILFILSLIYGMKRQLIAVFQAIGEQIKS